MGIIKGFDILAEERSELTDKLVSYISSLPNESYFVRKEGQYPKDIYVKNSHFTRKGKDKLKVFLEISNRGRYFIVDGKETSYDIKVFDELNKIINEAGDTKLYLFPFEVNGGIKKRKPKRLLDNWNGKLI